MSIQSTPLHHWLQHAVRGVTEGREGDASKPVEVMGLLFGYPCVGAEDTVIIQDAFPVPCKGDGHDAIAPT